jgi:hypothetical protein
LTAINTGYSPKLPPNRNAPAPQLGLAPGPVFVIIKDNCIVWAVLRKTVTLQKEGEKMELKTLRETPEAAALGSDHLRALWYDLNGDWDTAHRIVQQMDDTNAMWIHAYLHRKEPDIDNAKYWYRNAGKAFPEGMSFEAEAETILKAIL